jgi:nitrite reductase (NO-forming)
VVVPFAGPIVPRAHWLVIHLLLLGAATNAILVWSMHFTVALLRAPTPPRRRGEAARLLVLNLGVVAVLVGGVADLGWLGVGGSVVVFAAVLAHLSALAVLLRRSLPAPFSITVEYYLAAGCALLLGIPVGAWLLVVEGDLVDRLALFHAYVNTLGWITLTVLGTLLTLWPTVLRTRMAPGAVRAATTGLPLAASGLALLGASVLGWWPLLGAAGLVLFASAVIMTALPAVVAARQRPPSSFAAVSMAAAVGWLMVALGRTTLDLLTATDPGSALERFDGVLLPLLAGFVAQILLGAMAYLLPVVLGNGPGRVKTNTATLERHWAFRVVLANTALVALQLPVGRHIRIAAAVLVLTALVLFLTAAARVMLSPPR